MLDYLAAIAIGTLVFISFVLVFLKRDSEGKRGTRLGGCQHHHSEQGCDRCRGADPATIVSRIPDNQED